MKMHHLMMKIRQGQFFEILVCCFPSMFYGVSTLIKGKMEYYFCIEKITNAIQIAVYGQ